MNENISKFLPLIGLVIFILILSRIDIYSIMDTLSKADGLYILLAIILIAPSIIIKSYKWSYITEIYSAKIPFSKIVSSWSIGYLFGIVTPGRIGDLIKTLYIKEKISLGKGITTVIIDRIIDLFALFIMSIAGILLLYMYSISFGYLKFLVLFVSLLAFLLILVLLSTGKGMVKRIIRPLFRRVVPSKFKTGISLTFDEFYQGIDKVIKGKKIIPFTLVLSFSSFLIATAQAYLLAIAIGMDIDFILIMAIIPITILLDALPFSFSGIGTRDVALIFFLGLFGIITETAISFSLLILFVNYFLVASIGLLFWIKGPIKIDNLLNANK